MSDTLQGLPTEIRLLIFKEVLYNPAADVVLGNDEFEQVRPRQIFPELLRTCHQYYHEGREFLFLNKITFTREGEELLEVIKPLGRLACCTPNCHRYGENPKLRSIRFLLGDNSSYIEGDFYTKFFRRYLQRILGPIEIGTLTIELKLYCWAASNRPFMFCEALKRINLKEKLTLAGIGFYDRAITMGPGDMKATLCRGKPQICVVEPVISLVSYLNHFAWAPFILTSENVEDVPFMIRENMTTTTIDAAGNTVWVEKNYFVRYYSAYLQNGRLVGVADMLNLPPFIPGVTPPWIVPVIAAAFLNQQVGATGGQML